MKNRSFNKAFDTPGEDRLCPRCGTDCTFALLTPPLGDICHWNCAICGWVWDEPNPNYEPVQMSLFDGVVGT